MTIFQRIADELGVRVAQVDATVQLLDSGATVPFVARYRKEATGGLDDSQLRQLEERLTYLRELEDRRSTVLKSIEEQGKLTPELKKAVAEADTKTRLEDLYRPYMPKRRTKAQIAKEVGLEPLALGLLEDPTLDPEAEAPKYVDADKGVADAAAALEGARQILMEQFAEDAELVGKLREYLWDNAVLKSVAVPGKEEEGATSRDGLMPRNAGGVGAAKFSDYFDYSEPVRSIPSHRALALFRGRKEGVLNLNLVLPEDEAEGRSPLEPSSGERHIVAHFDIRNEGRAADKWLADTVRWAWRVKIFTHLDTDLKARLRESAEEEAIKVFGQNLHDLLLAAPAGPRATLGPRPGPAHRGQGGGGRRHRQGAGYRHHLSPRPEEHVGRIHRRAGGLSAKHDVDLVAIGNGTASRETDRLAPDLIKRHPDSSSTR